LIRPTKIFKWELLSAFGLFIFNFSDAFLRGDHQEQYQLSMLRAQPTFKAGRSFICGKIPLSGIEVLRPTFSQMKGGTIEDACFFKENHWIAYRRILVLQKKGTESTGKDAFDPTVNNQLKTEVGSNMVVQNF